jgi:serine/threonine protein kinase, bacterial
VGICAIELRPGLEPFAGYCLERQIGSGSWSEVWKARRPDGQSCALKFMECRHDGMPAVEVRALQSLRDVRHANVLGIHNVWSCSGYIAMSMELADGSLLDLLDVYLGELEAAMAPEHVCHFLSQAAEGIDHLNARQHTYLGQRVAFRHCDIKPANLLVFGSQVKVADFSLAVPVTAPVWRHRRVGTPLYCAPEMFQGALNERTDQYSLAITYYQLRTGRLPFVDTPRSISADYVRPAPELDLVSPAEQRVLARALAHVPQDRWPSCREMMQQLRTAAGRRSAVLARR